MSVNEGLYTVTIKCEKETNEKNNIEEKLTGVVLNRLDNSEFEFGPTTALCDLLDPSVFDENKGRLPRTHKNHPFFMGHEYQGEDVFMKEYRFSTMLYALSNLKDIIVENRRFTLSELEIAKQVFELKFSHTIEIKEKNVLYDWGYTINPINGEEVHEYHYLPIEYTFEFDWDKLFDEYKSNDLIFTYTCFNIQDIIFSVLHYLILHKYKFRKCRHCGRYFSTNSDKTIYCKRKSPYKGYGRLTNCEHLECEKAVRYICQQIRLERNRIDDHLCDLDRKNNTENSSEFLNKCAEYTEEMKRHFTVENLKGYEKLLTKCRRQAGMKKGRLPNKK